MKTIKYNNKGIVKAIFEKFDIDILNTYKKLTGTEIIISTDEINTKYNKEIKIGYQSVVTIDSDWVYILSASKVKAEVITAAYPDLYTVLASSNTSVIIKARKIRELDKETKKRLANKIKEIKGIYGGLPYIPEIKENLGIEGVDYIIDVIKSLDIDTSNIKLDLQVDNFGVYED